MAGSPRINRKMPSFKAFHAPDPPRQPPHFRWRGGGEGVRVPILFGGNLTPHMGNLDCPLPKCPFEKASLFLYLFRWNDFAELSIKQTIVDELERPCQNERGGRERRDVQEPAG